MGRGAESKHCPRPAVSFACVSGTVQLMNDRVYLDWNATAPLRPEARTAMLAAFDLAGNPSSVHAEGRGARQLVETARRTIAGALGTEPGNLIFTSGGTEANSMALGGGVTVAAGPVRRLIVSGIEHASVQSGGRFPPAQTGIAPVSTTGIIDLVSLEKMLAAGEPALVSVMLANNETGVIQPIPEVARMVHEAGGLMHVDAVQAFGKIPIDFKALGADFLSVSAHKLGGPKGVGALVAARDVDLRPLIRGGGQERNRRAGTENVAGIAGFGAAVLAAGLESPGEIARLTALRNQLEDGLLSVPGIVIFGRNMPRLPNTVLAALPGQRAETAVIAFDLEGIAVSSGSACSSGKVQPSHVLAAMGVPQEIARGAIRFSLGYATKEEDIIRCIKAWRKLADVLGKVRRNTG